MAKNPFPSLLTVFLLLISPVIFSPNGEFVRFVDGGKRRVQVPDDLDDVVDDEEDEEWKEWGKKKTPSYNDPPPLDFDKKDLSEIQAEVMKNAHGPIMGFVKLQLGVPRSPEMVSDIAMQWSRLLKTGSMDIRFMAVDRGTLMFNLQRGQDLNELMEYILSQPDAYEIKIGDKTFRRPGDPPVEQVLEKLHVEEMKKAREQPKEEL